MPPVVVEKRPPAVNESVWTLKEISLYYRVSTSTLYRWISFGYLPPPVKDFGSRRWLASEVIEAMKTRKSGPASCRK
jgi:predicted DNA-binding transcriptional regulator AlpA